MPKPDAQLVRQTQAALYRRPVHHTPIRTPTRHDNIIHDEVDETKGEKPCQILNDGKRTQFLTPLFSSQ